MREFLKGVVKTATFRQSSITTTGTIINGGLGALFYIMVARILGPADFGLLIVAITTLTLIADITDLGINTTLVRFVPKYIKNNPVISYQFLKLALKLKLVLLAVVIILGWFLAPFLASVIFKKEILTLPLKVAFFGVGGVILFFFSTSALQALQRFWIWSGIQIGVNALRLLVIISLWYVGLSGLISSLSVYIVMPIVGFLVSLFFLPTGFLKVKKEFSVARQFFQYSKYVALFTLLAAFSAKLDTFISARLLSSEKVGFYGAASQLVIVVPQIVTALGTVMAPKMASLSNKLELIAYLKKAQVLVIGLASLGLLALPVVILLIPIIYGSAYAQSVPVLFTILFLAMLIFLISVPIHMSVFYYFSYPKLFVWISLGHLAIIAILGWHMISIYGAIGAAITVLVGTIFNFVVPLVWVLKRLKYG